MEDEVRVVRLAVADDDSIGAWQSAHSVWMLLSALSAAPIPNASHAQLAYHDRPTASTRKGVRSAANGLAIRISPASSRTSA